MDEIGLDHEHKRYVRTVMQAAFIAPNAFNRLDHILSPSDKMLGALRKKLVAAAKRWRIGTHEEMEFIKKWEVSDAIVDELRKLPEKTFENFLNTTPEPVEEFMNSSTKVERNEALKSYVEKSCQETNAPYSVSLGTRQKSQPTSHPLRIIQTPNMVQTLVLASLLEGANALSLIQPVNNISTSWILVTVLALSIWKMSPLTQEMAEVAANEVVKVSKDIPGLAGYLSLCIIVLVVNTLVLYVSGVIVTPMKRLIPPSAQGALWYVYVVVGVLSVTGSEFFLKWIIPRVYWTIRWKLSKSVNTPIGKPQELIHEIESLNAEATIFVKKEKNPQWDHLPIIEHGTKGLSSTVLCL